MKRGLSHHVYSGIVATLPLSRSSSSIPCSVYAAFMSYARVVNPSRKSFLELKGYHTNVSQLEPALRLLFRCMNGDQFKGGSV